MDIKPVGMYDPRTHKPFEDGDVINGGYIKLSTDEGNTITVGSDGGILATATDVPTISTDLYNGIKLGADGGWYVPRPMQDITSVVISDGAPVYTQFSGTASFDIADVPASSIPHAQNWSRLGIRGTLAISTDVSAGVAEFPVAGDIGLKYQGANGMTYYLALGQLMGQMVQPFDFSDAANMIKARDFFYFPHDNGIVTVNLAGASNMRIAVRLRRNGTAATMPLYYYGKVSLVGFTL